MTIPVLKDRRITLGVTGGVAAYKAAFLASRLTQAGAIVDVVMTEAVTRFVTPLTFQAVTRRVVYTDMFELTAGESLDEVRGRTMAALHAVMAEHERKTILLIAHQVINKVLVCAMLGLDNSHFWHIRQDNGCFNIFEHEDDAFTAVLINDTCHLD